MTDRQPQPALLPRSKYDPVVIEDSLQHACILVGLLAGR